MSSNLDTSKTSALTRYYSQRAIDDMKKKLKMKVQPKYLADKKKTNPMIDRFEAMQRLRGDTQKVDWIEDYKMSKQKTKRPRTITQCRKKIQVKKATIQRCKDCGMLKGENGQFKKCESCDQMIHDGGACNVDSLRNECVRCSQQKKI